MSLYFNRRKAFRAYTPGPSTLRNTLGLNGSSEYATIAADASITMGDGSRSFVCKADMQASSSWLFQFGNVVNGHGFVDFALDGSSKLSARAFSESGTFSNQRRYTTTNTVSSGMKTIGITFNTWGAFEIYVDGVAVAMTANNTGSPGTHTGTYTMNLGSYPDASLYLNGSIASPMLFDKNLSAADHEAIHNTGVAIQPADFNGHGNPIIAALYSNMMFGIPFNDGEANEETDGSSNTNNATLQGSPVYDGTQINFEDGAPTYAASTAVLNGSSQYFQTGDSATFDFGTGGFSLSAWVKFDSFPDIPTQPDLFRIIGEGRGISGSGPKETGWSVYYNSTSSLLTLDHYNGTQTAKSVTWSASTSTWYHVTVIRDGNDVKFYVDGSQQGSTQTGVSAVSYNREESNGVYMGRLEYGSSSISYLDGSMGPYGVWDAALSASEITTLYNSGVAFCYNDLPAALTTNLVSYWHLANWSGSTGTEIEDRHGSNDVTNVGSTPFTGSGLTVECS